MRLAIVATPPLLLVSVVTLGLALRPSAPSPITPAAQPVHQCHVARLGLPTCREAHRLVVHGNVTGGASHVQLAGPVIYTDVTTDSSGSFELRVPIEGDVCALLPTPAHAEFSGDGMAVTYDIWFER